MTHHPALRVVCSPGWWSQAGLEKFTQQLNFNIISYYLTAPSLESHCGDILSSKPHHHRHRERGGLDYFSSINGHFTDPFNYNNLCSATGNRAANINAAFKMFFFLTFRVYLGLA